MNKYLYKFVAYPIIVLFILLCLIMTISGLLLPFNVMIYANIDNGALNVTVMPVVYAANTLGLYGVCKLMKIVIIWFHDLCKEKICLNPNKKMMLFRKKSA